MKKTLKTKSTLKIEHPVPTHTPDKHVTFSLSHVSHHAAAKQWPDQRQHHCRPASFSHRQATSSSISILVAAATTRGRRFSFGAGKEAMASMFRKAIVGCRQMQPWSLVAKRHSTTTGFSAVDSILLRSLKDHYQEVAKMTPPPKVSPPSSFTIVKGAIDNHGPVLKRTYGNEEISIYVSRLANIVAVGDEDDDDDGINQLFLHVEISKPDQKNSLLFLCGLYPDALGIHSVSMRPNLESQGLLIVPSQYTGPSFQDLDEKIRDALHSYIEERGVDESLFPFLQAWLYVKDNRNLMRWFRQVGLYISEQHN